MTDDAASPGSVGPSEAAAPFDAFVTAHLPELERLSFLVTSDRQAAADAADAACVDLYRRWLALPEQSDRRALALRLTARAAAKLALPPADRDGAALELRDELPLDRGAADPYWSTEGSTTGAEEDRGADPVWESLLDLAPVDRSAVALRWYSGLDEREAASAQIWRRLRGGPTVSTLVRQLELTAEPDADPAREDTAPASPTFEKRLRTTLRARAATIHTDTEGRLTSMRPRLAAARQRPRRSRLVPAAVLAGGLVLALAVGALVATRPADEPSVSDSASSPAPPARPGLRLVGYRSVAVLVPTSWAQNTTVCNGSPAASVGTVVYPETAGAQSCRRQWRMRPSKPPGSTVAFGPPTSDPPVLGGIPDENVHIDGHRVFRSAVLPERGQLEQVVEIPEISFQMVVRSSEPALIRAIVSSLRELPRGYTVVPACERLRLREAVGLLRDTGLRVKVTQSSTMTQRTAEPTVTHQGIDRGRVVPVGTVVTLGFPSVNN